MRVRCYFEGNLLSPGGFEPVTILFGRSAGVFGRALTTARTSKKSDGKIMALPCVKEARKPRTRSKQWNSGGGQT